jgi:hypothetical protein
VALQSSIACHLNNYKDQKRSLLNTRTPLVNGGLSNGTMFNGQMSEQEKKSSVKLSV